MMAGRHEGKDVPLLLPPSHQALVPLNSEHAHEPFSADASSFRALKRNAIFVIPREAEAIGGHQSSVVFCAVGNANFGAGLFSHRAADQKIDCSRLRMARIRVLRCVALHQNQGRPPSFAMPAFKCGK